MSRFRIGIAVGFVAAPMSSAALARPHLGFGPLGIARFALGRVLSLGRLGHARAFARHGAHSIPRRPKRRGFRAWQPGGAQTNRRGRSVGGLAWRPHRERMVATRRRRIWMGRTAVLAIRHLRYLRLRHLGYGLGFWDYGYPDISAAMFAPYGHDDLAAYTERSRFGRRHRRSHRSSNSVAMTAATLPASRSTRFNRRLSLIRRSAPHWTILPTH